MTVRYRLSTVPDIRVWIFTDINFALMGAKELLEKDSTVSIKIMKEDVPDDAARVIEETP